MTQTNRPPANPGRFKLEIALGLHHDREMGLVAMVGSGGILLELVQDVAFCAPPVSPEKARAMLSRTRAGRIIKGYRGRRALDADSVINALVALGALAVDLDGAVETVEINPFLVMQAGQGGTALDALIVLKPGPVSEMPQAHADWDEVRINGDIHV